jgi:hypothetical protein
MSLLLNPVAPSSSTLVAQTQLGSKNLSWCPSLHPTFHKKIYIVHGPPHGAPHLPLMAVGKTVKILYPFRWMRWGPHRTKSKRNSYAQIFKRSWQKVKNQRKHEAYCYKLLISLNAWKRYSTFGNRQQRIKDISKNEMIRCPLVYNTCELPL